MAGRRSNYKDDFGLRSLPPSLCTPLCLLPPLSLSIHLSRPPSSSLPPSFPPYLLGCHNTAIAGHGYEVECLCVWEEAKGGSGVRRSPHLHHPAADVVATYHVHIVVEKIGGGEPTDAISK